MAERQKSTNFARYHHAMQAMIKNTFDFSFFRLPAAIFNIFVSLYIVLIPGFSAAAQTSTSTLTAERRAAVIDSLEEQLWQRPTAADSVNILFNLFDLGYGKERSTMLARIYDTAATIGDTLSMLDAVKYQANISRQDTLKLASLRKKLSTLGSSARTRETDLFVRLFQAENIIAADTMQERSHHIAQLIQDYQSNPGTDPYNRIEQLFTLCTYIGRSTRGDLLRQYIGKLDSLVENTDLPAGAVRNLVYTRAAPIFTNTGTTDMAVDIDKRTLNIIDSLDRAYSDIGRQYRNFDTHRYNCYRRLLANYKGLTPREIDQFHQEIQQLAKVNTAIAADMRYNSRVAVFYNMAIGNYAEALKAIRRALPVPANSAYRSYMYRAMLEAAQAVGDRTAMLEAAVALNEYLNRQLINHDDDRYRELQIIYNLNELQLANHEREAERQRSSMRSNYIMMGVTLLGIALLLILSIGLARQKRRSQRLATDLQEVNDGLIAERNVLRRAQAELILARDSAKSADKLKTDFINNMSHEVMTPLTSIVEYTHLIVDCIPDDKRPYLDRFAGIIERSSELVMTIMNDVLDSSALENGSMNVVREATSVQRMCELALDNVFEGGRSRKKGIDVVFNPDNQPDLTIVTDPRRVTQVLINLLKNAEKFSEEGTITLAYEVNRDLGRITFAVEDKGIGIPRGKENDIFERFCQLDPTVPGCGLGLYISRLIARLLGGTLVVDTNYSRGARFLFTISL